MKTLLLYASKYGACEKVAKLVKEDKTVCFSFTNFKKDIQEYDKIIIGASVYAGMISKKCKQFIKENESILLTKQVFFYTVGVASEDNYANRVLQDNKIDDAFIDHITYLVHVGGILSFPKMNFFEKTCIKAINKKAKFCSSEQYKDNVDLLDYDKIQQFKKAIH